MIAPILIACKKRYAECAVITVETFFTYHKHPLYVVVDVEAHQALSHIDSEFLHLIPIGNYRKKAEKIVGIAEYKVFQYDKHGKHDRAFSALKPIIMDEVIKDVAPQSKYILSLDSDTLFSGNVLKKVYDELRREKHAFDIYLVERKDPRMLQVGSKSPGSGFTLWKRESNFIKTFIQIFSKKNAGNNGGSQGPILRARKMLGGKILKDPLLHFVSPDLKDPQISDKEILKIKPAYIHLHGKDSFERLTRFRAIFEANT